MALKLRDASTWTQRHTTTLLPFLYHTSTLQRRPYHNSPLEVTDIKREDGSTFKIEYSDPAYRVKHLKSFRYSNRNDPPKTRDSLNHKPSRRKDYARNNKEARKPPNTREPTEPRAFKTVDDDLPFEGLNIDNNSKNHSHDRDAPTTRPTRDTTITDLERNAFARLFDRLAGRYPSTAPTTVAPSPEKEDLDITSLLSETSTDLSDSDYLDLDHILDSDLRSTTPIDSYPPTLQPMAARAHAALHLRTTQQAQRNATPAQPQTASEEAPMHEAQQTAHSLKTAPTDTAVLQILETQVFAKVRALNLDASPHNPANSSSSNNNNNNTNTLSKTYAALTLLALRLLIRRTAYTPLALTILPSIHALGPSAHALLASGGLYNDLIAYTWTRTSSLRAVNALCREMDAAGLVMGRRTYGTLGKIMKYRELALQGGYGEGVRAWEGMLGRGREAEECRGWMDRCWVGVEEEAREKRRRREWEEMARLEEEEGEADEEGRGVAMGA